MIGDNIKITIVDIRGDKVRLGISAPKEIPVHRKEVWENIQRGKGCVSGAVGDFYSSSLMVREESLRDCRHPFCQRQYYI